MVNDIDLSCLGLGEDGLHVAEFSWRTDARAALGSRALAFSGDVTSGWNGGSEYFDVELEAFRRNYPSLRYLVICANVYTSYARFSQRVCRAGYMMRDVDDSGEVFEPSTVQSSFTIDCDSSAAFLFALDLAKYKFVWLNVAHHSQLCVDRLGDISFLVGYLHITDAISLYSLTCVTAGADS